MANSKGPMALPTQTAACHRRWLPQGQRPAGPHRPEGCGLQRRSPPNRPSTKWTRGVKEGLTRYQEMFSQLPGFGGNGAEVGETRSVAREQLIEFNTELLSYA